MIKQKIALATFGAFMAVIAVMAIIGLTGPRSARVYAKTSGNTAAVQQSNNSGPDNEVKGTSAEKNSESAIEQPEGQSQEKDLPGGHQDPDNVQVGHQFDGAE